MKTLRLLTIAALILLTAASFAFSSVEDDGVWVTKEVREPLAGVLTADEVRNIAKNKARDMAVEEALGSFVKSSTLVHNYQIAEDIINSVRRGIVVAEEVVKDAWIYPQDDSDQLPVYSLTLRVKVKPIPVEKRKGVGVKLSLNRDVFKHGEDVVISIKTTMDSYIYVFDVFQNDTVTLLVPNKYLSDNTIKANSEFIFPGVGLGAAGIHLRAMLPQGAKTSTEKVKVIASTERIEAFDEAIKEAVFKEYDGKNSAMIMDVHRALGMQDPATWTEATVVYEIRK